ncbi:glycosyltransferase family 2 protein [Pedobacter sp. SD-b]|uniref:Glycosyltransferase family 2 protein n=1 Tax=Pedobacter segetis TaxID=2793069 RepID=A0ABS1BFS3_9SPHI|nr:glycosyltransferase family A protein [Pedobacter segetis]MBK0381724.1 glycosyltransferase family 2 protein [Pedobacter segetis]
MYVALFSLPKWLRKHQYKQKKFADLTSEELNLIKAGLAKLASPAPEVSIIIPAWNEEDNIFRTLSSLAANQTKRKVEIVVINNNSTDQTQTVLEQLGVKNFFQPEQGITFARQMGLENAKGKYHLCADSDTFYPPKWIDTMIKPLENSDKIVGVYARYAFIPEREGERFFFWLYERFAGIIIRLRKKNREHINFLGFNMGFKTAVGLANGGFKVKNVRKFDNALGSDDYVDESEDGRMAVNLMKSGNLFLVTQKNARVFTSSRRLIAEGGILKAFKHRFKLHTKRLSEYINGKKI